MSIDNRHGERRAALRPPVVKFRAGLHGKVYDNVNFARSEAEGMANGLMQDVVLYQMVDGRARELHVIRPDGA
jgi:hypothetical protein